MEKIKICRDSYEVSYMKRLVEEKFGHKLHTPSDFQTVAKVILEATHEYISISTLKRVWGYIDGSDTLRFSTLNVLVRYIGYENWDKFLDFLQNNGKKTSCEYFNSTIEVDKLAVGEHIHLGWWPDRRVEFEYKGELTFEIVASENSKLCVGDTFKCAFIIEGESLVLDHYIHEGMTPTKYLCGRVGGVKVM